MANLFKKVPLKKVKTCSMEWHPVGPTFVSSVSPSFLEFKENVHVRRESRVSVREDESLGACLFAIAGHVYVTHVYTYGVAWKIGLSPGDQIYTFMGSKIRDPQVLMQGVKDAVGEITFSIVDASIITVQLKRRPLVMLPPQSVTPTNLGSGCTGNVRRKSLNYLSQMILNQNMKSITAAVSDSSTSERHTRQLSTPTEHHDGEGKLRRVVSAQNMSSAEFSNGAQMTGGSSNKVKVEKLDEIPSISVSTPKPTRGINQHGLIFTDAILTNVEESSLGDEADMTIMLNKYSIISVNRTSVAGVMSDAEIDVFITKELQKKREVLLGFVQSPLATEIANAGGQTKSVHIARLGLD